MSARLRNGLLLLVLAGLVLGAWWWKRREDEAAAARALAAQTARTESEAAARVESALDVIARVQDESRALMPAPLTNVSIGMLQAELQRTRRVVTAEATREYSWLKETLSNGAEVMYGFDPDAYRLMQVQVLSTISREQDFARHLSAMNDTYGVPTAAWNCEDDDGIPTRRFTWRKGLSSVMDVILVYGTRASLTLYIAPTEIIAKSLEKGHCVPVGGAAVADFPEAPADRIAAMRRGGLRDAGTVPPGVVIQQAGAPR